MLPLAERIVPERERSAPERERTDPPAPSGFRPLGAAAPAPSVTASGLPSAGALAATSCWLVALTMLAVDTVKADFRVALAIAAIQAGLVVAFFMRVALRRSHLALAGFAALLMAIRLLVVAGDRGEYQPALDEWATTPRAP
jgi:hypothetical protein